MKKVLYISYDGMTDPLGQSQVISYLIGLTKSGYQFDILSFEKPDKFAAQGNFIRQLLKKNNIGWYPQVFHSGIPLLSKLYDRMQLQKAATQLQRKNNYMLIHCRSYLAVEAGLKLKKRFGVKVLFDMRGFWPDEKAEGNSWDRSKWLWNKIYLSYKKKEKVFIQKSDHIISLTRSGKKEIESWSFYSSSVPVTVIPCCADGDHFSLTSEEKKSTAREKLNIGKNKFVISYLGSLGTWYMLDEMVHFFEKVYAQNPEAFLLIITNSDPDLILSKVNTEYDTEGKIKVLSVPFTEVPSNMYASDMSISFIRPVYSKMASSPIKIGEILSMGIPIVANNIGDSGTFIEQNKVGCMLEHFTDADIDNVIENLPAITSISPHEIREIAISEYSLEKGTSLYGKVYQQLLA